MKTLVIIGNHNLPEYTDYLYEALKPYERNDYNVIVFDNGSSKEGESKYTSYKNEQNIYFGGLVNGCFDLFLSEEGKQYDSLMIMNNDLLVFGYNFIRTLQDEMIKNDLALVSGCFFNIEPKGQCFYKTMHNWGAKDVRIVPFIDFQMPMFHRRLVEKIGQYDKSLLYGWGNDVYAAITCKQNNWKIGVVDRCAALHYNSMTVKKGVAGLTMQEYCRNAEIGQREFFQRANLMNEFNEIRKLAEGYTYENANIRNNG